MTNISISTPRAWQDMTPMSSDVEELRRRIAELEALLIRCLDDAEGVNCLALYRDIKIALGRAAQ